MRNQVKHLFWGFGLLLLMACCTPIPGWETTGKTEQKANAPASPARPVSADKGTIITAIHPVPALLEKGGKLWQPVRVDIQHNGDPLKISIQAQSGQTELFLQKGLQKGEVLIPAVEQETAVNILIGSQARILARQTITVKPVRKTLVYILPHSHTDIGYTEIQTTVEDKQINNLLLGIHYAQQTADYPEGARFVWNVEVAWAAQLFLERLSAGQKEEFLSALKNGRVSLQGMYLNELTGLCRPEELLQLFQYGVQLSGQTGALVDSAMISDVPGYTWGTVTAMALAGIKYFSVAPNFFDRIGDILVHWENKPFYWVSPSGRQKVLVWIPYKGYALSHILHKLTPEFVEDFQTQLDKTNYPYDIAYLRWSGQGDNATPDPSICDFVRDWNRQYAWPKFRISSTSEAFRALEQKYSEKLPRVKGDWSPYWEDGAGSSALETSMNRWSSDRLSQAETLWAMIDPARFPAPEIDNAWRNVLLYSEHTWGAYCSISDPSNPMTKEQWEIKQSYALQANRQSYELLMKALEARPGLQERKENHPEIDVYNTTAWQRTELLILPKTYAETGDLVTDLTGQPIPSQRLASGELAILVRQLPPFSGRRLQISAGKSFADQTVKVQNTTLDNGLVHLELDEQSGNVKVLKIRGVDTNLVDSSATHQVNEYLYLIGDNPANLQRSRAVKISIKDKGPLVASLLVESEAPGTHSLSQLVRLVAGLDYVELVNTVDKRRLEGGNFSAKEGKESVNFAFPLNVPGGELLLDLPLGGMRPEKDQIPSACKNWLTIGRWAEVANRDYGITWVTLDAPLVQIGGVTATLLNSQTNPAVWRKTIEPSQKIYSWAMNNHWGTNYRAYQSGPTVFRYLLHPHLQGTPAAATRFATSFSQPLIAVPAKGPTPSTVPLLQLDSEEVILTALRPSTDGKALMVHLFGASGKDASVNLKWGKFTPTRLAISDLSEKPRQAVHGPIEVPAWEAVILRGEMP
jgi:alpha-mannosidase